MAKQTIGPRELQLRAIRETKAARVLRFNETIKAAGKVETKAKAVGGKVVSLKAKGGTRGR